MSEILLYHGSKEEVVYPEIRITRYTKDFSWGFYCTSNYQQAYRWADRRSADGLVNVYRYVENPDLKILRFPEVSDHILPMIFGLAGNGLNQAANIENVIFLLFGHGWVHSSQRSGSAKRLRYES